MARPKDPQREARNRREILKAARACFSRHGFHQTTMRQIIEQSGKSAGSVYHYYSSKENIVEAIAAEERQGIDYLVTQLTRASQPIPALIQLVTVLLRETPKEDAILASEVAAEACRNPVVRQAVAQNDRVLFDAIEHCLHTGQNAGQITTTLPATQLTQVIVAHYEGLIGHIAQGTLLPKQAAALTQVILTRLLTP